MNYIDLLTYLMSSRGENLRLVQAVRNISRIRKMDNGIKRSLNTFLKTGVCDHEEAGVSFVELVNDEQMKPIRAFLMLDWLKREPIEAMKYLAIRGVHADLSKVDSAAIKEEVSEETDKSEIQL